MTESLASSSIEWLGVPPRDESVDAERAELERLESRICELAGHLAAATCQFLLLVGEFDARQGWATWDLPSCSAWLAWKCQVASGTAREHVRVARALRVLPVLQAEFAAGRMSYAKVRALTRIAEPDTESILAELAGPMTAEQLERFVAAHRRVSRADDERAAGQRHLTYRVEEDGQLAVTVRLPGPDGAVLLKALRAAADDLEHPHDRGENVSAGTRPLSEVPAETPEGRPADSGTPAQTPAGLADALMDIAGAYLGGRVAAAGNPDVYQVVVHADADVLATGDDPQENVSAGTRRCHLEDGPAVSPATARRIACDAVISWMAHDHDGSVLDVGRTRRRPPRRLRRAVLHRDGYRCRWPGCNSRRVDLHHIIHWADGGPTRLDNLISLCTAHHVIVHAKSHQIRLTAGGQFDFALADGTPLPASPPLPGGDPDLSRWHRATITPGTVVPIHPGDKLDLDLAIWACFANTRIARDKQEQQLAA